MVVQRPDRSNQIQVSNGKVIWFCLFICLAVCLYFVIFRHTDATTRHSDTHAYIRSIVLYGDHFIDD